MCPSSWKLYVDDFPFFWFLSSSSRTQVRALWSFGVGELMPLARLSPKLQTALAWVLDKLERNQKKRKSYGKHMRNNWELRKRGFLIRFGHTKALLLKKKDIKRPFFPPCRYWPICEHCSLFTDHWTVSLLVAKSKDAKREGFCSPLSWFYFYRFLFLQIENLSPTERNQEKRWITLELYSL